MKQTDTKKTLCTPFMIWTLSYTRLMTSITVYRGPFWQTSWTLQGWKCRYVMHMHDSDDVNEDGRCLRLNKMVFSRWNKLHRRKKKLGVLLIEHEAATFRFVFRTLYHWAIDNSLPVRPSKFIVKKFMDTTRVGISTFDTFAQQLWSKYRPAINLKSLDFSEV